MDNNTVEADQGPKDDSTLMRPEITSNHALGLQDLYKAAFSQEAVNNFNEFQDKTAVIATNITDGDCKYYTEPEELKPQLVQEVTFKNEIMDDAYQLYSLKSVQYSVDFTQQVNMLEVNNINYQPVKTEEVEVLSTAVLSRPFETFQNDGNSVLDLDKGIQIHLVKAEGAPVQTTAVTPVTYTYETCDYTGDAQILQRYLSDTAFVRDGTPNQEPIGTVTVNFVNKQNMPEKNVEDNDTVGVNPETLGIRFEDCDFNSSDSFASTESIIPKNIKCPKCPKKFMFKSDLTRHDKYKHSARPKLSCKYCSKEFANQQNLLFHEKSHKKKKNKCDTCKKVFKNSTVLAKHMLENHSKSVPFACTLCSKIFTAQTFLNIHMRRFHEAESDKSFKCDVCWKRFEKRTDLRSHVKTHFEENAFACLLCNKTFSKISYLRNHRKSHMKDNRDPFVCETCGKDFKTVDALEEHSKKHTKEKPFTCHVCMKGFSDKFYFKMHIKRHGDVKPHVCAHCLKSFDSPSDLNEHEKEHDTERIYQCSGCNVGFSKQSHLLEHVKKGECTGCKSQEVCTQTTEFDEEDLLNVTHTNVQPNVNIIIDPSYVDQQPIVLTSIGSVIDSNSVPVILTQNPIEPYSVPSIT